jgi:hypothetical protein
MYEPAASAESYEYYVDERDDPAVEPYEPAPYDEESDKVSGIKDGDVEMSELSADENALPL